MSRQPRRGWVGGLLALLCPGLGHVYAGRPGLGLALMLVASVLEVAILLPWLQLDLDIFTGIVVAAAAAFVFWIAQTISAVGIARHAIIEYPRPMHLRLLAYVGFFIVSSLLGHLVSDVLVRGRLIESHEMSSASMLPNVLPGDVVLVKKFARDANPPRRGDIIVFSHPETDEPYLKRLIAKSGTRVEAQGNQLQFDGELMLHQGCDPPEYGCFIETSLDRVSYRIRIEGESVSFTGSPAVPEDHMYVLGDNRNNSHDSRQFGPVPWERYQGRVVGVLYSVSDDGIRWARTGLRF